MESEIILDDYISIANLEFVFWFFKVSHHSLLLRCPGGTNPPGTIQSDYDTSVSM